MLEKCKKNIPELLFQGIQAVRMDKSKEAEKLEVSGHAKHNLCFLLTQSPGCVLEPYYVESFLEADCVESVLEAYYVESVLEAYHVESVLEADCVESVLEAYCVECSRSLLCRVCSRS